MASTRSQEYISDADKKMDMSTGQGNSKKPVTTVTNGETTREKDDTALKSASRSQTAVDARGGGGRQQQQQQQKERSVSQSSEKPFSAAVNSSVSSSVSQREDRLSSPTVWSSYTAAAATSTRPRTQTTVAAAAVPAEESLSLSLLSTGIKESKGWGGDAAALFGREHPSSSSSSLPARSGAAGCAADRNDDGGPVAFKTRGVVGGGAMTVNFPSSSSSSVEKAEIVRRKELKAAFDRFDKNRDGKITKEELGDVLKVVGDEATDEELTFMIKEVDKNGDGVIDWDEFVLLNTVDAGQRERELRAAFRVFDRDDNGYITVSELYEVLRNLDDEQGTITEQEVERMIARVDSDGDGYVNYVEFKRMMEIDIDPSS